MPSLNTLNDLLIDELRDLYSAETQLVKALPKIAEAVSNPDLKEGIEDHLEQTKGHVMRLEKALKELEASPKGKKCKAMEGLIEEGQEAVDMEGDSNIRDLDIIGTAQRVEHYEIAAYGCARTMAEQLGLDDIAELLQETLDEESAADKKLTQAAEEIYPEAPKSEDERVESP